LRSAASRYIGTHYAFSVFLKPMLERKFVNPSIAH
jgi:hypothetical protein